MIGLCAIAAIMFATSCEKILKDLLEQEITVNDVEFETGDMEVYPAPEGSPEGTYHEFSETQTVNLNDFEGAEDLKKYNTSRIKAVTCESAIIYVYSTNNRAGDVKDFLATTTDSNPTSFKMGTYKLGDQYSGGDVKDFVEKLMFEVLTKNDNTITLSMSGLTNLPDSEKLKLKISIKGIKVKIEMAS
jgi:hypothetical protein